MTPRSLFLLAAVLVGGPSAAEEGPAPGGALERAAPGAPARRPNIVLAIADDWGWPHAGAYGDRVVRTPAFDRIAREGLLFSRAFVSSPSCTPSRGAIVTGQHFFRLGAGANLWCEWPGGRFAEYPAMLARAGYHAGSYRKGWGPGKGNPAGKRYATVDAFFAARPRGAPFCFWFGSSDPHRPYERGAGVRRGMKLEDVHLFGHLPDAPEVRGDVADYYFEVERFDRELGRLIERIEGMGELDDTIVVVTGDHGMPFPRGKANVYDAGARVPLALRWGARTRGGRTIEGLVSLVDLAPTFLEAAGLEVPAEMTGRSLLGFLAPGNGGAQPGRGHVLLGRERHTQAQEAPEAGGYPVRALRTEGFLYVRNLHPDRWPAGTPHWEKATFRRAWLSDCDNGPTKTYLWERRGEPGVRELHDLSFAKRPAEELYDLTKDSGQLRNVAADAEYAAVRERLARELQETLEKAGDPRATGGGGDFDRHPYLGGAPQWEGAVPSLHGEDGKAPVKVFILAGQSNMEGKAKVSLLERQVKQPATRGLFEHYRANGKWAERDDVFIKFLDRKGKLTVGYGSPGCIGPELELGHVLGNRYEEPVLLIKTAWGGRSLHRDFRPPGAGLPPRSALEKMLAEARKKKPEASMAEVEETFGASYRAMLGEVKATLSNMKEHFPRLEGRGHELAGFIWFQGWNDMIDAERTAEYTSNLAHFIRDVRKDLASPALPFVVGQMGVDGAAPGDGIRRFKAAQAAVLDVPGFEGNVALVKTDIHWDLEAEAVYKKGWREHLDEWNEVGSDWPYHYLGSARTLCAIGKAFGEAVLALRGEAR